MFWSKNKKKVYTCKPQFYYIKVGCKGVFVTRTCFRVTFAHPGHWYNTSNVDYSSKLALPPLKIILNGRPDTRTCEDITPQKAVYTQHFAYFTRTFNTLKQAQICIERPANENKKNELKKK